MLRCLIVLKILIIICPWESAAITNKRPSQSTEQSGSVRYFRHISSGPSSGPLANWEVGLREAINQALLREGYWEPNLRERLNSAQFIGRQDLTSTFGDVVVLARGQLYAIHGGNFMLLQDSYQNDCDDCHNPRRCERHDCQPYTPHNREILVALWTVKRLRHRDVDRTRFELEYIINPVNAENDQIIMRRNRFNYAIPGHVFVIRSSETNKNYPEYYNRKIVQTQFKPEVILGVDSDGHKHVLYSYPGFITTAPQMSTNEITTTIPGTSATQITTNLTEESELYKKLLEILASKTSTTQNQEGGPHRFSLNKSSDTNQSITTPLISESTSNPIIPTSTKPTVHYFMPTGEEVLMTEMQTPSTSTERVTPRTTLSTTEKSTTKPTKKYYSTKASSKPKITKFTTPPTTTSTTSSTTSTTTSTVKTTSTTELLTTPTTTTTTTTISTTPKSKFTTKSRFKPSTSKSTTTSSITKTSSFYPTYRKPTPFSFSTTKLRPITTERLSTSKLTTTEKTTSKLTTTEKTTTEQTTTMKMVPTTTASSTTTAETLTTTESIKQQTLPKMPTLQTPTVPMKSEATTISSTAKYTSNVPLNPTTGQKYTVTKSIEEQSSNENGSLEVHPTEPMKAVTEAPTTIEETEIPTPAHETQGTTSVPKETIGTTLMTIITTLEESTTQIPSLSLTTSSVPTTLPSTTATRSTTTESDFLTEAEPYKGPLYVGTVRNDYGLDDIFGTTKSTEKPSTTTTVAHTESDISHQLFDDKKTEKAKIIFSNFYEASTASINQDDSNKDSSILTSQSYETSVSYEVNKRNQPEYVPDLTTMAGITITENKPKVKGVEYKHNHSKLLHYKPSKITKADVKQMPSNGTEYVIYKAEYPNEVDNQTQSTIKEDNDTSDSGQMKTTKEMFDDVALMLVNHAKSLEYLSKVENRTVRVKYRRRKTYVPRARTTRKPVRKVKKEET